jgi:eukaryotic-like serine/threonine-protein kinase
MTADDRKRFHEVQEALDEVLSTEPSAREASIERICARRGVPAEEVRVLLEAADGADEYFESISSRSGAGYSLGEPGSDAASGAPDSAVGRVFGAYRLGRRIGVGGMGAVYHAERADDIYEKSAAVKLLPPGLATEGRLRRFDAERRILARLQHPGIAALLDGGVSGDGIPYFVMEFVDGVPIDRYCEERRLPVEQRLRLFLQVARAVAYAHQSLVVHRDLKPSNILVTEAGDAKLLDFGIATLLQQELEAEGPSLTEVHGAALTPAYASPEQVRGEALTTAADVYSLGVLLYQMLAGRRPYEVSGLSPARVERLICEEVPPPPSEAAVQDEAGASSGERFRSRGLRGDLDTIVMKALQKDPERRYASVGAMAEDVERHLAGYPVLARRDSLGYRVSRFVRRNRSVVVAAAAAVLLLVGFSGLALYTAVATRAQNTAIALERDRAQLEFARAEAVSEFLIGLFGASNPDVAAGEPLTARQLLEQGARDVPGLTSQPAVQARVLDVIAQVYTLLGDYDEAEPLFREAVRLNREVPDASAADLAGSLQRLGDLLFRDGRLDEASMVLHEAIELATLANDQPLLANALNDLGLTEHERGDYSAAERLHRNALEVRRGALGDRHARTAASLNNTARALARLNRGHEAEALYREALEIYRDTLGPEHTQVANTLTNLGTLLSERGEHDEAIELLTEALRIKRHRLGDEHPSVANGLNDLGALHAREGRLDRAADMFREALVLRERALGPDHPHVAVSLNNISYVLFEERRFEEALPLRRRAFEIARDRLGTAHDNTGVFAFNLAEAYRRLDRLDEAEVYYRESWAILGRAFPQGHPLILYPLVALGELLVDQARTDEATPVLQQALELNRSLGTPEGVARVERMLAAAAAQPEGGSSPDPPRP